jgi:hypothetical protein
VQDPVDLKTGRNCVIFSKDGIFTVPMSVITGHMAFSRPIAATATTGFSFSMDGGGGLKFFDIHPTHHQSCIWTLIE